MREGLYALEYTSHDGFGAGVLVLQNGKAYGADPSGARFDGGYDVDPASGAVDLHLKITYPAHTQSIFGLRQPHEWGIDVALRLDSHRDMGATRIVTPLGPAIDVVFRFMRSIPEA